MKPRRILIFSLAYYPRLVGGAEVAVKEITGRIPAEEMAFDMITLNAGGEQPTDTVGRVAVHRLFGGAGMLQKLAFPFAAARKARELHAVHPYDAVWSIMASYAGYAAQLFKKSFPSVPLLLTIQEGDHFGRRSGALKPLFRKIFRAADRIQAISTHLAEWAHEMGGRVPAEVVPNGVDLERFLASIAPEAREKLRAELGAGPAETLLITASRLVYKNAVDDIIRALPFLEKPVKLIVLGSGPDEHKLRALAARLGAAERAKFMGYVPHDRLADCLKAADIFVRPSRTEGLGNSFLEAMAAGIPVIGTPVGGIPDFLTDGETGLFCEPDNARSIAQKVEKLVRDRESRDYIVSRARELVRSRYGWDDVAVRMKRLLDA